VRARFHVGDTPMDIQAALGAGARAIGVATGVFERAALERLGAPPDVVVLDDLNDLQAVLGHLGL
jgi:phosphoglycolate phosphatase-like HAD superfamily hydrolase